MKFSAGGAGGGEGEGAVAYGVKEVVKEGVKGVETVVALVKFTGIDDWLAVLFAFSKWEMSFFKL